MRAASKSAFMVKQDKIIDQELCWAKLAGKLGD